MYLNICVPECSLQSKSIISTTANPDADTVYVLFPCVVLSRVSSLTLQKRWYSSGHFRCSPVCPLRHLICVSLIGLPAAHQPRKQLVSAAFLWSVMAATWASTYTAATEVAVQLQSPGLRRSFDRLWRLSSTTYLLFSVGGQWMRVGMGTMSVCNGFAEQRCKKKDGECCQEEAHIFKCPAYQGSLIRTVWFFGPLPTLQFHSRLAES